MIKRIGTDMAEAWLLSQELIMKNASDKYVEALKTGAYAKVIAGEYVLKYTLSENAPDGLKPGRMYVEDAGTIAEFDHHGNFYGGRIKNEVGLIQKLKARINLVDKVNDAYELISEANKHDATVHSVFSIKELDDLNNNAAPYVLLCSILLKEKKVLRDRLIKAHQQRGEIETRYEHKSKGPGLNGEPTLEKIKHNEGEKTS